MQSMKWAWQLSTRARMDPSEEKHEKTPILHGTATRSSCEDSGEHGYGSAECKESATDCGDVEIRVYRRRWVVLVIIVADLTVNYGIWIAFAPIADAMKCYYGISDFWVNSVSMVYMLTYILFVVPSLWLLERVGLRTTSVIAACFNAVGACLKVAGVGERELKMPGAVGWSDSH